MMFWLAIGALGRENQGMKTIHIMFPAFIVFASAAFAVDPTPDGGYPNQSTAEGENALFSLTTGANNTAVGYRALFGTVDGDNNTAVGWLALQANTGGLANTATGANALVKNTTGDANTAVGMFALYNNSTGSRNTTVGVESFKRNTGSDNIGLGYEAGMNIGSGSNNIDIGKPGSKGESNNLRIGTVGIHTGTFIAGINGVTVPTGITVVVDGDGHLGTITSSARFKEKIRPMSKASEAIFSLQPVAFCYKEELDPTAVPQFGLVAEEVAKVAPDLVARDKEGKPYTVRYEAVNAMLLNEFLKEHKKAGEQARQIDRLEGQLRDVTARLDANGL